MSSISLTASSHKYVNDKKTIERQLESFFDEVAKLGVERLFIHSTHGRTDLTLICNNTFDTNLPALFILKFTAPCLNLSARVNSVALQRLGMKAPTFYSWDTDAAINKKVSTIVKERFSYTTAEKHFTFMEAVPGADLGHLISTRALFKLTKEDWYRCLNLCGKVAVFDLLLANDDRFYRPHPLYGIEEPPIFCNKGNLMLHLPLVEKERRTLDDVFCIDNASTSNLRTRTKKTHSKNQRNYLTLLFEAFKKFNHVDFQNTFASIIFKGISNHIRLEIPDDRELRILFLDRVEALPEIRKGIIEGYRQISELDPEEFLQTLKDTHLHLQIDLESVTFMEAAFEHIRECLNHLQGGNGQ